MSRYANLPVPSPEQGLNRYLQEIRKFPMLETEEEYMLGFITPCDGLVNEIIHSGSNCGPHHR